MNPRFSIVVPCYNIEHYLEECLTSILNQSFYNYEVILVNDGSTDKTLDICQKYVSLDKRFKVISKNNEGLSATRNLGIEKSTGDYIVFLDGDDFMESDALEQFDTVAALNQDIIITRLIEDYGDEQVAEDNGIDEYFEHNINCISAIKWVMERTEHTWPAVKYVVLNKYIRANTFRFLTGYLHEDLDWTTRIFSRISSVGVASKPWYHYRQERTGSITNAVKAKRITDVIEMSYRLITGENAPINYYPIECKDMVINRIMQSAFQTLATYKRLSTLEEKTLVIDAFNKYNSIFRYQPKVRYKLFMIGCNILGKKKALDVYSRLK